MPMSLKSRYWLAVITFLALADWPGGGCPKGDGSCRFYHDVCLLFGWGCDGLVGRDIETGISLMPKGTLKTIQRAIPTKPCPYRLLREHGDKCPKCEGTDKVPTSATGPLMRLEREERLGCRSRLRLLDHFFRPQGGTYSSRM